MTGEQRIPIEVFADDVHARAERGWLVIEQDGEWWSGQRFPIVAVGCVSYNGGPHPWVEVDTVAGAYRWYAYTDAGAGGRADQLHAEIIGALTASTPARIVAAIAAWWKENIRWNSNWC